MTDFTAFVNEAREKAQTIEKIEADGALAKKLALEEREKKFVKMYEYFNQLKAVLAASRMNSVYVPTDIIRSQTPGGSTTYYVFNFSVDTSRNKYNIGIYYSSIPNKQPATGKYYNDQYNWERWFDVEYNYAETWDKNYDSNHPDFRKRMCELWVDKFDEIEPKFSQAFMAAVSRELERNKTIAIEKANRTE